MPATASNAALRAAVSNMSGVVHINVAEARSAQARVFNGAPLCQAPSGVPTKRSPVNGWFITPTTGTAARRMTVEGVVLGPYKYVGYIHNKSGQTVSSGWTLTGYPEIAQST